MADFNGSFRTITPVYADFSPPPAQFLSGPGRDPVKHFLMAWRDPDCGGGSPTYRTWSVEDTPDPTGLEYAGAKCGATPISGAFVLDEWFE